MRKNELAFGRIPAYCKYELFMERYRSAAEIIRYKVTLNENIKFLDVGCGVGYMKYFFGPDEGQWFGVDCWTGGIEIHRYSDEGQWCGADCLTGGMEICKYLGYEVVNIDLNENSLPYPDEFFDIVIASHVIEHLSNIDFSLKEMDRVLKKNGLLLIATPTKPPLIDRLINLFYRTQHKKQGETQHAFSVISLKQFIGKRLPLFTLIDSRGFRIISARKKLKLENFYIFYKINTFLGKYLTFLVPEVNLIYKKKA